MAASTIEDTITAARCGDLRAWAKLEADARLFIVAVARRSSRTGEQREKLIEAGFEGLREAVMRLQPVDLSWSAWRGQCIRRAMAPLCRDHDGSATSTPIAAE